MPIVVVEGEKKSLALLRLANLDFQRGDWLFLPLGLSGVWSWRGKVGTISTANGAQASVNGLIPDFSFLELSNREVTILYDSNVVSNSSVRAARNSLAKELTDLGASVHLVDIPVMEGVNGIDDLLGLWEREHGTEAAIVKGLALVNTKQNFCETSRKKLSQPAILMELAGDAEITYFHSSGLKAFATLRMDSHYETHEIRSSFFREWLSHRFWESEDRVPSSQALDDVLRALCGKAKFMGHRQNVFVRIACSEDSIYLDLANNLWQVVEITKAGWQIIHGENSPVKFRRPNGSQPLPTPEHNHNPRDLSQFINVIPEDLPLVCAWLVACLRPGKPIPLLILNGEQGSAKSTTSKVLKRLIDPNLCELRSQPRDERDLMISANNNWLLAFDNLSKIPEWLSDAFCRLVTGNGFATRTLYANDEETLFSAMRPILLNGITELATKPDLLDRALLITCPNISKTKRLDEEEFWSNFERSHAGLLGAFLTAISATLANLPEVRLAEKERMADFEKLAVGAEAPLGFSEGLIRHAYKANRRDAHGVALDSSSTAALVIAFITERERWEGTATCLLTDLKQFAERDQRSGVQPDDLPKRANALSGELKRVAPILREYGIEFRKKKSGKRSLTLENVAISSSGSSESTGEAKLLPVERDDSGTIRDVEDDVIEMEI
jgi:hypothetical protein